MLRPLTAHSLFSIVYRLLPSFLRSDEVVMEPRPIANGSGGQVRQFSFWLMCSLLRYNVVVRVT